MSSTASRSFVLGDDDHFAPPQQQWARHILRRFHRGPDARQAVLAAVAAAAPRVALEVGASGGEFAARVARRLGIVVVATDERPELAAQAQMRHLAVALARPTALPTASAAFGCVLTRCPLWAHDQVGPALREIGRVLVDDGVLVVTARSPARDGHELDDIVGCRLRRPAAAFTADNAGTTLADRFQVVDHTDLGYAVVFPSGAELASYLMALPARRHLADRVSDLRGPLRLTYGLDLFVASAPRR